MKEFYRGTNPVICIEVNFDTTLLEEGYVTFVQNGKIAFEKTVHECECEGNMVMCQLTQEETLELKAGQPLKVQMRVKLTDGTIGASDVECLVVNEIFKDGVI